jgi:hypothetical protein
MAVHWKAPTEKTKVQKADCGGGGSSNIDPGKGKKTCSCGYRIRGKVEDHENGMHHKNGKK